MQVMRSYRRVEIQPDEQQSLGEIMVQALIDKPFDDWISDMIAEGPQPDGSYEAITKLWGHMLAIVKEDRPLVLRQHGRAVEYRLIHSHAKDMAHLITSRVNQKMDKLDEPRISPRSLYNKYDSFHHICKLLYFKSALQPLNTDQIMVLAQAA
jgi:hypothetical protein